MAGVVVAHQVTQARASEQAVDQILLEQELEVVADALLNSLSFTTDARDLEAMLDKAVTDFQFDRLIGSLVQDAGRAAESVAVTARPNIWHIRYVNPPCCARCAVLAGRVYRWSEGFKRHPGCDCSMIPTTVAAPFAQSAETLFENGQIRGLSKADAKAVNDGVSLSEVVNIRRSEAGLIQSGRAIRRAGRLTPEGIYQRANGDRGEAVRLLTAFGYLRP